MRSTQARKPACGRLERLIQPAMCSSSSRFERTESALSARGLCTRRKSGIMKKKIPAFKTDREAERFVAAADLTQYDLSGAKAVRFEVQKKDARINMRVPDTLLTAVRARAAELGIPYQRLIREGLEYVIAKR